MTRIGIIGAGHIGATAARLLTHAGYSVALSNSRGPTSLNDLITDLGPSAHPMTVEEAARFGELVLLAVPWRTLEALPSPASVAGKVVIDAMNPYSASGTIIDLHGETSSGIVAQRLPGARIVKAFNTIYYQHLAVNGDTNLPVEKRKVIFLAGDDAGAKEIVAQLITEIGFAPVDTGGLVEGGRKQEPGSAIYNRPMNTAEAVSILNTLRHSAAG